MQGCPQFTFWIQVALAKMQSTFSWYYMEKVLSLTTLCFVHRAFQLLKGKAQSTNCFVSVISSLVSGWSMEGPQGEFFWRAAFVNLEKYRKVYQIRFIHILPESNCQRNSQQCTVCKYNKCPAANVAISSIRLDCQKVSKTVPVEVCKKREVPLSGCEILADMPSAIGKS